MVKIDNTITKAEKLEKAISALDLTSAVDTFILGQKMRDKLKPEQIALCKQTAIMFGLNPLKREIHFIPRSIKRKNQQGYWEATGDYDVSIVVGYEVYLKRADQTKKLNGWSVRFEGQGADVKAILNIYRKDWDHPFEHEVSLSEVQLDTPVWKKMPKFMLRKTVIGQGFRLCFPEDIGGMPYIPEEIGVGVVDGGQLKEDAHELPPPPPKISEPQIAQLKALLEKKGKKEKVLLSYFKIDSIDKLTQKYAELTINRLVGLPDADKFDLPSEETVDLDEADEAIQAAKLQGGAQA